MQNDSLKYIPRIAESILEKDLNSGKVFVITGARQVGKTTLIKTVLKGKNAVFLNFDIDVDRRRFLSYSSLDPSGSMEAFNHPSYLVIDEAQRLPECVRIVKGWYDSGLPVRFVLLGSSSFQLSDRAAESLAGRNRKLTLPPLTFLETVRSRAWYNPAAGMNGMQEQFAPQIETLLLSCMAFGQYPEAVASPKKRNLLLNLASDTLWKDLLQMGLIKTPELIRRLLVLLAHQAGSEFSVNELAGALGMARSTVERYLDMLEQAFVIFRLPAFSTNPRKEISKSQKVYFWDTGIRNALLDDFSENPMRPDIGSLWENWAVAEFAKQNLMSQSPRSLYFWRSRSGAEVDLVMRLDNDMRAYEMKWNPAKKERRTFTDWYGAPVYRIDRTRPLFRLDE